MSVTVVWGDIAPLLNARMNFGYRSMAWMVPPGTANAESAMYSNVMRSPWISLISDSRHSAVTLRELPPASVNVPVSRELAVPP